MQYVGSEAVRFDGRLERREEDRETCVVLLSGHASLLGLGEVARATPFDGPPVALYVPPRVAWWAEGAGELAVCTAPASGSLEPRLLDSPELSTRGEGGGEAENADNLMESGPAQAPP